MIKKTLYFGNPQPRLSLPATGPAGDTAARGGEDDTIPEHLKRECERTIPIEDIGVVVLDNRRITITSGAISALLGTM